MLEQVTPNAQSAEGLCPAGLCKNRAEAMRRAPKWAWNDRPEVGKTDEKISETAALSRDDDAQTRKMRV
jgi:hypothetical protein